VLLAAMSVPAIIGSQYAHKLEKFIGKKNIIWLLPIPAITGYLLIAFLPGWWAVIFIYLVPLTRGLNFPILSKHIHDETFSDKRATVLSVQNWLFRLAYFGLGPFVGWIGQTKNLSSAFIACAVVTVTVTIVFIPLLVKGVSSAEEKTANTSKK